MYDPKIEKQLAVLLDGLALNSGDVWKRVQAGEMYQKLGKHDDAMTAFRRVLQAQPDYAPAHAGLGNLLAEQGKWKEAEAALREAIRLKPDLVKAHVSLAEGYAKLGEDSLASQCYAAALALKPDMVSLLRGAATVALKSRRLDEAVKFLTLARAQAPDDPDVLLPLGLSQAELGLFAEAREVLDVYVNKRDKPAEAWVALGRACDALGDARAAAVANGRALAFLPDDADLHFRTGRALGMIGEHEKAVRILERAAKLLPDRADVHGALGTSLLAQTRFDLAAQSLTLATKLTPEQPLYHVALARAELGLGKPQNAADSIEHALRLDGSSTDALLLLAKAYMLLERAPDATTALRRAVTQKSDDASLHFELAAHHKRLGHYPQALAAFRDAAARKTGFVEAHLGAAACANELEQLKDAVREYEAAIAAAPDRADAQRGLGTTLRRLEDHAAAIAPLLAASRLDANDGEVFLWLADSRFKLGKREDALSDVRQAIRRRPEDSAAHHIHGALLVKENRHTEAIVELEAALKFGPETPETPEVLLLLGECRKTIGKLDVAEQAFVRGAALLPKDARFQDALGRLYLDLARYEEAVDKLERADHLRSDDVETLRALGVAYLRLDMPRESQRTLEKALSIAKGRGSPTGASLAQTYLHHARALIALQRAPDARQELLEALKLDPNLADAHFELGMLLAKVGELEPAAKHLESATRTATDPADAYGELARVRRARGEIDEALLAFKQRLRARPNDAEAHFGLAETLTFVNRDAEAVSPQRAGLALEPKRAGAWRRLGEMLVRISRHDEAIVPLETAIASEAPDATLFAMLASCHERADDTKKEVAALLQAVEVTPEDAALLKRLGLGQRKIGQAREATATLTRAITIDPKLVELEVPLGELHHAEGRRAVSESEFAEAASELEKARRYHREDVALCIEHATALRKLARYPEAAAAAQRASELAKESADIFHLLGELREATEEHEAARVAFGHVVRLAPTRFSAQLGLGHALMRLGQSGAAIEPLSRAVAIDGEHVPALAELGLAQQTEKKYADARDSFLRLTALRPLDADPLHRLVACRVALHEDDGALVALTTLARLIPDDLDVLEATAQCQERLGKLEDSVASYERLLGLEPERIDGRRAAALSYAKLDRHDDVVRNAKPVLRARPEDQELLLALARAHAQKGRASEACDAAGELVRLTPKNLDALWELASAEVSLGRDENAIATLERAIVLPECPPRVTTKLDELMRRRAEELEKKGDAANALTAYQRVRELAPTDPTPPLAIARCLHLLTRSQEALDVLRTSLKAHPAHGGSWLLLGRLYTEAGYSRESVDAYKKAAAAEGTPPERFDAFSGLGFACAEVSMTDEAIVALERAIEIRAEDVRVKTKLADLYESSGRRDDAIRTLTDLRGMRGLTPEEHRRLGLLCAAANRHADAVEPLTQALVKSPNDATLLEPLATALEALQRDADAARILARLRDASSGHPNASSRLGFAFARLGQHSDAAAAFEVARAKETPRADVLNALVAAHTELKDETARRSALEALVRVSPNDLVAYRALGFSYDAAARRDDAITALARADELSKSSDLEIRKRLAELYLVRARDAATPRAGDEDLAKARRAAAKHADLLLDVARSYASRKLAHEAAASAREVLALDGTPENTTVDAALLLGTVLASDGDARGAADAYELALKHRVDQVEALVGAGNAYLSLGKPDDAISMLRRAVTADTERLDAHTTLGETLRARGRDPEAVKSYREIVRLSPTNAEAWRTLGDLLLSLGEPREASEAFERAVALKPNDAGALLALATAREKLGQSSEHLEALMRAHRATPDDAGAAARYGLALAESGDHDAAITTLERARSLDSSRSDVVKRLVGLLGDRAARRETQANARGAESDFAAAVVLSPDSAPLRLGLARAFQAQNKSHEALSAAEEATTRAPEDPAAWLLLGELRARLAHDGPAADAFTRAVRYDGRSFDARVGLAAAKVRLGDPEAAVTELTRATEIRPDAQDVHAELARLHEAAGRAAEAASALARLGALRPLTKEESRRLGMLAAGLSDHATCATALGAARPSFPEDPELLLALGIAESALGHFDLAIDPLEHLVKLRANHPKASALLGLAYARTKRWDEAAETLGRAIAIDPRNASLHDERIAGLETQGRAADRIAALDLYARTFAEDARVARLLGLALADAGRDEEAIPALERARTLDAKAADVAPRLATLYLEGAKRDAAAGNTGRAIERGRSSLALAADPTLAAIFVAGHLAARGDHAEAAALYERALEARLDAVDAIYGAARAYVALGRAQDAVAPLRRAARVDPTRLDVHRLLASTLTALGDAEGALLGWGEVLRLAPDDADALLARGRLAASLGRHEEARGSLERALSVRSGDAEVLFELSNARGKLGLGAESLDAAEALARATPSDARAQRKLGEARAAVGKSDGAIEAFERAQSLDGTLAGVSEGLGRLLFERGKRTGETGDFARSAPDFQRAAALLPTDPEPSLSLARALRTLGRLKDAIDAANVAITRRGDHVIAWVFLGEVQAELGMPEPAAAAFASALRFDRNVFAAQLGLGLACRTLGRSRDAEEALDRAATLRPDDPQEISRVHVARAELFASLGRNPDAIAAWQLVGGSRPLTAKEQRTLGQLYTATRDAGSAASALEQAVSGGATDLDALLELAAAYEAQRRTADAATALERIVAVDPAHAVANERLGRCYAALGRHEDAVRALSIVRRIGPPSAPVLEELVNCLTKLGRKLEAVEALTARAALSPKDARWLIRVGAALADVEREDEAATAYERARALPDAPPETAGLLAAVYLSAGEREARKGNHDAAIERFSRCLAVDPRMAKARLGWAQALVQLKRPDEAMSAAHGALTADPTSLEAAVLLGDLYGKHGKDAEAAQIYEYSMSAHPGSFELAFGLGKSRTVLKRWADAAKALKRAVEIDPTHLFAKRMLARALESDGKIEEACTAWAAVIAAEPEDGVANYRLGLLRAQQKKHAEAITALERARHTMTEDMDLALALAGSYEALERFDEASRMLAVVSASRPKDSPLYERLSSAQQRAGRHEAAAVAYQKVIDLGRRDLAAYLHLGGLYERAQRLNEALRAFQGAYALDARNMDTIQRIAAVMHALGRTAEAIQWLQGANGIDPRNAQVHFALAVCYIAQSRRAEAMAEYEILGRLDRALGTKLYYLLGGR